MIWALYLAGFWLLTCVVSPFFVLLIEGQTGRFFLRTRNRLKYARFCFSYQFRDGYPEPSLLARVAEFACIMLGLKACPHDARST